MVAAGNSIERATQLREEDGKLERLCAKRKCKAVAPRDACLRRFIECFRDPNTYDEITTCTMIVREANAWTAQYHDRMPWILLKQDFDAWLDGSARMELLKQPPRELPEWIVSKRVNKAGDGDVDPTTIKLFKDDLFNVIVGCI